MLDRTLAIAHHLLVFALFGSLPMEFVTARAGMDRAAVARVAAVDLSHGLQARPSGSMAV